MTTRQNLTTIATHWTDLYDALTTTGTGTWPPAGRMNDYLAALDQVDAEEIEARRALRDLERSPEQLGETRAPIRLHIHDTMRAVEAALLALADQIAADIQRPVIEPRRMPRGWNDDTALQVALLCAKDAADSRRWRYVGTDRRTAPRAALWLLGRYENAPGPFRALTEAQAYRVEHTAAAAADRVEGALQLTRTTATTRMQCACTGTVEIHGGDGHPPTARCTLCGRTYTAHDHAA
ncbi:hypothetical protein ACGFW5_31010 [Streptomyces sp. NPDC048416]|uniref:hypothetical protein n=1 Tax=Streptomyces sp. NPDC048416 TaxID=3365546 RepID=UPI003720B87C